jgi:hypothetical protein
LGDIRIERLNTRAIPAILGESGFQAFLHPSGVGNCFVVEEEASSDINDLQWISEKRQKALFFAQVLQYYKDGVVHLGYSVPVFLPEWAGQVRRSGVFFLGELRRLPYESGNNPISLTLRRRNNSTSGGKRPRPGQPSRPWFTGKAGFGKRLGEQANTTNLVTDELIRLTG